MFRRAQLLGDSFKDRGVQLSGEVGVARHLKNVFRECWIVQEVAEFA
jgi:hypothetical protein